MSGRGSGGSKNSDDDESLKEEFSEQSSTDTDEKKRTRDKKDRAPKSTVERKGWYADYCYREFLAMMIKY